MSGNGEKGRLSSFTHRLDSSQAVAVLNTENQVMWMFLMVYPFGRFFLPLFVYTEPYHYW